MGVTYTVADKIAADKTRIRGIEFDIAQLKSTNHNGRNDKSIKDLERAIEFYRNRITGWEIFGQDQK